MKKIYFLAILLISINQNMYAGDGDTVKINYYTKYDLQQWKGSWYHKKWDVMDPAKKYKKAYLSIKLGCASYGCCVWDYGFHAYIIKPLPGFDTANYHKLDTVTGNSVTVVLDSLWVNQKSTNYEVGRLITPYGTYMRANSNGFNNNTWQHPYIYDITDYLPLLKDSFGVAVQSGGYDGKKGFNMTMDLILIEGESDYNPAQIYRPYAKSYSYQNELQIDTITKPFKFKLSPNETNAKFRTIVTGHGQEGEFSPIEYRVKLNGNQIYSKRLWKTDCDKTYIQPQGGTWIFSRCNWCPGEKTETFEIDLTPFLFKTDSNEIDISFGTIENTATSQAANYDIMGHIITYSKKDVFDLSIDEVIAPSKDPNFILSNSLCQGPKIRLKNNGTKEAKEAYVDYWVDQNNKTTHIWKGSLMPDQTVEVNLPAFPRNGVDYLNPKIYFSLQKTKDNMTTWNDNVTSLFNIPTVYNTSKIKFEIRTSNDSKNDTLRLYNEMDSIIMSKVYKNDAKLYSDTITLVDGCYRMELVDYDDRLECGDGLSFWWSTQQMAKTAGTFKLVNGNTNAVLKTFNPDFGGKLNHQFTINNKRIGEYLSMSNYNYQVYSFPDTINKDTVKTEILKGDKNIGWSIYPNPSNDGKLQIKFPLIKSNQLELLVYNLDGKNIFSKIYINPKDKEDLNLSKLPKGTYFIRLNSDEFSEEKKWINQ